MWVVNFETHRTLVKYDENGIDSIFANILCISVDMCRNWCFG